MVGKKKIAIIFATLLLLTMVLTVFVGCDNNKEVTLSDIVSDQFIPNTMTTTSNAFTALDGKKIEEFSYPYVLAYTNNADSTAIAEKYVYNIELSSMIASITQDAESYEISIYNMFAVIYNSQSKHLDIYSSNSATPVYSGDNVTIASTDIDNAYFDYIYLSDGTCLRMDMSTFAVRKESISLSPSANQNSLESTGSYLYQISNDILSIYDKNLNFVANINLADKFNLSENKDIAFEYIVLDDNTILFQTLEILPESATDYDIYTYIDTPQKTKFNLDTYKVNLSDQSVSSVDSDKIFMPFAQLENSDYQLVYSIAINSDKSIDAYNPVVCAIDSDLNVVFDFSSLIPGGYLSDIRKMQNGDILLKTQDISYVYSGTTLKKQYFNDKLNYNYYTNLYTSKDYPEFYYNYLGDKIFTLPQNATLVNNYYMTNQIVYYRISEENADGLMQTTYYAFDAKTSNMSVIGTSDKVNFTSSNYQSYSVTNDDGSISLYNIYNNEIIFANQTFSNQNTYSSGNYTIYELMDSEGNMTRFLYQISSN